MAKTINRLSATLSRIKSKVGRHHDGQGLYLAVTESGGQSWLLRYMVKVDGKSTAREMGLGPLDTVGLTEARDRAAEARKQLRDGIDPLAARQAKKIADASAKARTVTFRKAARILHRCHVPGLEE